MRKFIFFFLGMFFPQQAAAITQIVNAGEVLDGGDVHIVVTQRVYGTTKNFTVSGNQQVMSGGEAYNSNIFPYGQQNVEKGGVSHNTNVQYYAVQNVNGEAYSSTVASRDSGRQCRRLCAGHRSERRNARGFFGSRG